MVASRILPYQKRWTERSCMNSPSRHQHHLHLTPAIHSVGRLDFPRFPSTRNSNRKKLPGTPSTRNRLEHQNGHQHLTTTQPLPFPVLWSSFFVLVEYFVQSAVQAQTPFLPLVTTLRIGTPLANLPALDVKAGPPL